MHHILSNTWFERISMIAILINCITLGSYQPCYDTKCESNRCQWLKTFDHVIFLFFFMEMLIKMVAMGVSNAPQAYLADYWNRLDCFIVIAGGLEYVLDIGNVNLTAIRTVRVLRPLRAINRIPSMRILVTLLLDTLPMLGNVLLLCFFVFFIFGIIGVQLWSGLLRQRCFISLPGNMTKPSYVPYYYRLPNSDKEYLCSTAKDSGLHRCQDLPPLRSSDLTTLCQNPLPLDWQPPSQPTTTTTTTPSTTNEHQQTHFNESRQQRQRHRYPDRFVDGELVPFDLVPGDEASPFLVKQMSPLIAQSVFQPAFAPRQFDLLPSLRQKRDLSIAAQPLSPAIELSLPTQFTTATVTTIQSNSGKVKMNEPSKHPNNWQQSLSLPTLPHHIEGQRNKSRLHHHSSTKLGERIRIARLANIPNNNNKLLAHQTTSTRKLSPVAEAAINLKENDPMVETNANSDQFASMSQTELIKSDKSSRKYYKRKKVSKGTCINWNKYYVECRAGDTNPFQGTISFDNVGMAWTTIFLVISLEGWSDIMYLLQDSHSFWVWIYFVLLIVIGSFFMINLCLVVIATQFSATKKREMERMRQERLKSSSSSTLTATSESTNCYTVIVKSIARLLRHTKQGFINSLKKRKCRRLHKQRLRERLQHIESHQVTGIHSESGNLAGTGALTKRSNRRRSSNNKRDESRGQQRRSPQAIKEGLAPGQPMTAAIRRSSWKKSTRSSARKKHHTDQHHHQQQLHVDEQAEEHGDLHQASGEQLISRQETPLEEATAADEGRHHRHQSHRHHDQQQQQQQRGQTNRRLIKLCHAECGSSCRAMGIKSSKRQGHNLSKSKAIHSSCRHYHECDINEIEISFCPKFIANNSQLQEFKLNFNRNIKSLVDHRYFQRLILLAILINAISMGIEYHNQPEQLTEAVEISNIVFACLFLVEMILKLIAHGLYDYVIDGFNCFDGCIVILSILELFESSSGSGLSVLRTFRLLRILKLVRFMPALRRQLVIMLRTLDNVAVFFALLVLFIFIFSILGMNLFGCKFCETLPDGTERCDRKNFNSLLWSLVTVFQILTQEDWNVVLFNGMEKTSHWAALYFVLLMTFGNYVLFNLLVAILVEGFSQEDDLKVSSSSSYTLNNSGKSKGGTIAGSGAGDNGGGGNNGSMNPQQLTEGDQRRDGSSSPLPPDARGPQRQQDEVVSSESKALVTNDPSHITVLMLYRSGNGGDRDREAATNRGCCERIDRCQVALAGDQGTLTPVSSYKLAASKQNSGQDKNDKDYDDDDDNDDDGAGENEDDGNGDDDDSRNYSQMSPLTDQLNEHHELGHQHESLGSSALASCSSDLGSLAASNAYFTSANEKYRSANKPELLTPIRDHLGRKSLHNNAENATQGQLRNGNKNKLSTHNSKNNRQEVCWRDKSQGAVAATLPSAAATATIASATSAAVVAGTRNGGNGVYSSSSGSGSGFGGYACRSIRGHQESTATMLAAVDNNYGLTIMSGYGGAANASRSANRLERQAAASGQSDESNNVVSGAVLAAQHGGSLEEDDESAASSSSCCMPTTTTATTSVETAAGQKSLSPMQIASAVFASDRLPLKTTQLSQRLQQPVISTAGAATTTTIAKVCNLTNAPAQSIQQPQQVCAHLGNKQALNGATPPQTVDCGYGATSAVTTTTIARPAPSSSLRIQELSSSDQFNNEASDNGETGQGASGTTGDSANAWLALSSTSSSNDNDGDKLVNPATVAFKTNNPATGGHSELAKGVQEHSLTTTTAASVIAGEFHCHDRDATFVGNSATLSRKVFPQTASSSGVGTSTNASMRQSGRLGGDATTTSSVLAAGDENYCHHRRCNSSILSLRGTSGAAGRRLAAPSPCPALSERNSSSSICNQEAPSYSGPITYAGQRSAAAVDCLPMAPTGVSRQTSQDQQLQPKQASQQKSRYWDYRQLVTSTVDHNRQSPLGNGAPNQAVAETPANARSLAFLGFRRPAKRLVYFYDINDDIDEEIDFLTKSLETKSYATSMMGQHDHYLDNISKNEAAAAKTKSANKAAQAQYKINMYRDEQERHIKALALDSGFGLPSSGEGSASRFATSDTLASDQHASSSNNNNIKRSSQGSASKAAAALATVTTKDSSSSGFGLSAPAAHNVELVLSPHWSSMPSHLNQASIAMMRFYQSSYTNNLYLGKRERAILNERGQFDKSCCRIDYEAYTKALSVFLPKDGMPIDAVKHVSGATMVASCTKNQHQQQRSHHNQQPAVNKAMTTAPATTTTKQEPPKTAADSSATSAGFDGAGCGVGNDINLDVIYEPFKLFPNIASSALEAGKFTKRASAAASLFAGPAASLKSGVTAHHDCRSAASGLVSSSVDDSSAVDGMANFRQRELLVSLENYTNALARYEERQALGKRVQENSMMMNSGSNLNRTTQALRRGSVVVLSKLKLLPHAHQHQQHQLQFQHQQNNEAESASMSLVPLTTYTRLLLDNNQHQQLGTGNNVYKSVPKLSLTKAESLATSISIEADNSRSSPLMAAAAATAAHSPVGQTTRTTMNVSPSSVGELSTEQGAAKSFSRDGCSEVTIHMSSDESLASQTRSQDLSSNSGALRLFGTPSAIDNTAPTPTPTALQPTSRHHLHQPHGDRVTEGFTRHSIANLPLRALTEASENSIDIDNNNSNISNNNNSAGDSNNSSNNNDFILAGPASYTPSLNKRSLPRPSLIGWFNSNIGGGCDSGGRGSDASKGRNNSELGNRNSCFSQTSKASVLSELLRPNLRRRRSFSGPFEWLQHEHKRHNDMMLTPVKKQPNKRRLRKMKPQKSNSSDYHSLNNRRVYKLDSRGFQTKLKGVFYVITHDPFVVNLGQPALSQTPQLHSSSYNFLAQQQERDNTITNTSNAKGDVVSSNEVESSFFNTSNDENSLGGRSQSRDTNGCSMNSHNQQQRRTFLVYFHWTKWMIHRRHYSLFIFSPKSRIRRFCLAVTSRKEFDYFVLFFISMNCVTLAMERPKIPPWSKEREFLTIANYYFTFMFTLEMALKVISKGLYYGKDAYLSDSWNIMDGALVGFSLFDLLLSIVADRSPRIFAILRVFRLLRSLRPLRVINRLMGLKLVVQTLLLSLRPIGNIVLICCTFFIIFGILGVQLFKGTFYYCDGPDPLEIMRSVRTKEDCMLDHRNRWVNRKYNFDNLGQALMALFVLSSKDGWVNIMYTGLDAVGVNMQPRENYNEWRLLYFISFLLLVAFFVLNMFVGVVVENFHRCRKEQELEEKARRAEKRQRKLDKRRRKLREPPYYSNYGKVRLLLHKWVTGGYFDLLIAAVIGFNVIFMSLEHYQMPGELIHLLKVSNYVFTAAFILEAVIKSSALGMRRYLKDRWNQLDVMIVAMSIVGIIFEEMDDSFTLPINPTLLRVLRVMRIARVLKLLKMAKGIRALLDTVMQALPQVGNLGLLFFLLFFIFAALGVELFGRLECNDEYPCSGLMDQHAHFQNFGLAFLTLFRVATGDNWNGIMKDTLRDKCDPSSNCLKNCCVSQIIAPLYFVVFVLLAQFVLVNVVVAVLMKHLEESHHEMEIDEEYELDKQLAEELEAKRKALLEAKERQNIYWA